MTVVQINACYEYSSTGRTCLELHTYLSERGYASYKFYSMPMANSDKGDLIGNIFDHKLHALLSRIFGKQAYFSHIPTYKLIQKLRKISPDIVILRNLHGNYINLPMLTKFLAENNIATIIVLHDCWFFTGYCCHYTEANCFKWQKECFDCPLIKTDKASWFFDTTREVFRKRKKMLDRIPRLAIVGVSDWITEESRKSVVLNNAIVFRRIYNWINLNVFYPRLNTEALRSKLGIENTTFVALGVSMSWSFRKGLEVFIQLAEQMPDITIVMVGQRPNAKLPSNIIFVPATSSSEELAQYYSMANVLLNFSIQETFGKVAAEALACGTPLIVNNATANPELPGDCGYVVNNIKHAIEAINDIRKKGKAYYQERCVSRARLLFDKDNNIEQYIELFNELTKPNN